MKIQSSIRNYDIVFGPVKNISNKQAIVIVDTVIYADYPQLFEGVDRLILIDANEGNKEFFVIEMYLKRAIELGVKKSDVLIAVGGGVVQDIVGFMASILFRGCKWWFIPTTLLSQADSCIGGKTSINFNKYKNLIGTFYPPEKIYCDVGFLKTLPEEEIKSGIGEILHYYVLFNKHVEQLRRDYKSMIARNNDVVLIKHIMQSLELKKAVIEADEFDKDQRTLLNYGHTFGHAIERVSDFNILHGLAVTVGMDIANFVSWRRGFISEKKYIYYKWCIAFNLPKFKVENWQIDQYITILLQDKKNEKEGGINFILPHSDGFKKTFLAADEQLAGDLVKYFNHE